MEFVNRKSELEFLEREYNLSDASLIILYGRRRIGKTALMTEFGKNKEYLYFLATKEAEIENRETFKEIVANFTGNEWLKEIPAPKWETLFKAWADNQPERRKLLFIDEFQFLGKSNPAFPSIFQKIWDMQLKDRNVMVILCGSLITLMQEQTLNYSSPLYGRRTGQIRLKQVPFIYYHEFYPEIKDEKKLIEYYGVTGGVPKYIELFNRHKEASFIENIKRNVLSNDSFLYEEPIFLLQNEIREIGSYLTLLKVIAAGNAKLGHIASVMGLKTSQLTVYLKTLINLDILTREVPITESNPEKSKSGLYKIKDNFMAFWFRFVYPNTAFLETGQMDYVSGIIKKHYVENHLASVYESICLEKLWKKNAQDCWPFRFDKAGRWWNKDTEIDLVAYESSGDNIIFGECNYLKRKMDVDVFYTLLEKKKAVDWKKDNRKEWYMLCSVEGYTDQLKDLAEKRQDIFLL